MGKLQPASFRVMFWPSSLFLKGSPNRALSFYLSLITYLALLDLIISDFSWFEAQLVQKLKTLLHLLEPGFLPAMLWSLLLLFPNWVFLEGYFLALAEGLRFMGDGRCVAPLSFIIFIYCSIVTPFETVIVIRSSNKLDLLTAPVAKRGEEIWRPVRQTLWSMRNKSSACRMKILGVLFQRNLQCRQKRKPLYLVWRLFICLCADSPLVRIVSLQRWKSPGLTFQISSAFLFLRSAEIKSSVVCHFQPFCCHKMPSS